jgi:hypothetical protein
MRLISVHAKHLDETTKVIWINVDHIISFKAVPGGSDLEVADSIVWVTETPEQIRDLLATQGK